MEVKNLGKGKKAKKARRTMLRVMVKDEFRWIATDSLDYSFTPRCDKK